MLVVTMGDLPGYRILAIIGEVVGVTARGQNRFAEGVPTNDNLSAVDERHLIAARREAVERMAAHAHDAGATAVVSMRFTERTISPDWVEICAYGTAVVAAPQRAGIPGRFQALQGRRTPTKAGQ
ncbi:YbjQ family protein [Rugosimonospora acidiphila]